MLPESVETLRIHGEVHVVVPGEEALLPSRRQGFPKHSWKKKGEKINEIAASDEVSCSFLRILYPKRSFCSFF